MSFPARMWEPDGARVSGTQMEEFRRYCEGRTGRRLEDWEALYAWSVEDIAGFWECVWAYAGIVHSAPFEEVVDDPKRMPGARWFRGARLNFAENLLRFRDERPALVACREGAAPESVSYGELYRQVCAVAAGLRARGVGAGDRVAGVVANTAETVAAMLAASALGAVWTSCSPDFGVSGILDRFRQVRPKVLFAHDGYRYKGRWVDLREKVEAVRGELPDLETVVSISYEGQGPASGPFDVSFEALARGPAEGPLFEPLPFDHPLYILYSSGTTGLPKAIVHGAGGTLIQHLKEHRLHTDLRRDDVLFYYTTCSWMMWNWLVSGLATGATLVLYDGAPFHPKPDALWRLADRLGVTVFGTSAQYLMHCEAEGVRPAAELGLTSLRAVLSTGSPLSEEGFDYVYRDVKEDVQLASISGGTDIISCFALGNPVLPVHRGELQCRGLGMKVEVFDEAGRSICDRRGELVCTAPFPSMPTGFWNDPDGARYRAAYFERFPGVWHHGDYVLLNSTTGGLVFYGRSDATLNPGGVRIGTAEIYRALERLRDVRDSLVVGQRWNGDERVVLFVELASGAELSAEIRDAIRAKIRGACSPRHVPARIVQVPGVPYTRNGKKVELAVRRVIHGEEVLNREALANPEVLEHYCGLSELAS